MHRSGSIHFAASRSTATPRPTSLRSGIAYVPESMGIFGDLTVRENMLLAARGARRIDQVDTQRLDWIFGLFPALKKFWLYPAGKLSRWTEADAGGGARHRRAARAAADRRAEQGPGAVDHQNLIGACASSRRSARTILLVEQNFMMARALGDHVAVMDDGRVVHAGAMAELVADEALQHRLLGLSLGAH